MMSSRAASTLFFGGFPKIQNFLTPLPGDLGDWDRAQTSALMPEMFPENFMRLS